MRKSSHLLSCTLLTILMCLWNVPAASGVVETIDATVAAQVDEYFGTEILNSESAFEDLEQTTGNLPLIADTGLRIVDTANEEVAGAQATTTFRDPRLSEGPNPGEFGIDAAAFSMESGVHFSSWCTSQETREITFLESEIDSPPGTELAVRSQFFVDGFLMIWGEAGDENFAHTTVGVELSVDQQRPGDEAMQRVFDVTIRLEGRPDGNAEVFVTGGLTQENIVVTDISAEVPGFGPAFLVVIPEIGIPYDYAAAVDEPFVLVATVDGQLANQPGTGVGVALGVPVEEFSKLIDDVTSKIADGNLGSAMRTAVEDAPPPAKALPRSSNAQVIVADSGGTGVLSQLFPMCGMFGAELLSLLVLLPVAMMGCRGKRVGMRCLRYDSCGRNGRSETGGY